MRLIIRPALGISALLATLLIISGTAAAHTAISPSQAAEGSTETFSLNVGHDCDGSPVTQVRADLSRAFDQIEIVDIDGWDSELEEGSIANWTATDGFEGSASSFEFAARVTASEGSVVPVPVIQICLDGQYDWIQVPGDDEIPDTDDHSTEPAPLLTVTPGTPVEITTTTTTAAPTTTTVTETTTTVAETTTTEATTTTVAETTTTVVEETEDEDGSALPLVLGGIALVAVVAVGAHFAYHRRKDAGAP